MMTWAIMTDKNVGPSNLGNRDASPDQTDERKIKGEKVGEGQIWYLPKNSDIKSLASTTPNAIYESYNRLMLEEIATALSIPVEILTLNFKSGQVPKQAVAVAIKTIERFQKLITSQLIQRVWNWRIAKAIKDGDLTLAPLVDGVSQWYRTAYQFPGFDWADGSEDQSNLIAYNMGTRSLTEISRKAGKEFEDTLSDKCAEIEIAIEKAAAINKKHGTNLSFRELIVSQNPGQFSAAQTKQQEAETGDPKK
jgi:capsid protein